MILHLDMDAFFASIEQAVNPRLKGKPLVVGARPNKLYTVVCAASYEAKVLGIGSGMPTREAFRICPNLEFVAAEQAKYIWTSEQIFSLLKGYGLPVVYASIDEFQMDIADELGPLELACDIQKRIRESFKITASVGIAKNRLLAKLASKIQKPNGITILTDANLEEILCKTPLEKLAGMGGKIGQILPLLGVENCRDIYRKPAQFLEQNLGKFGLNLYLSLHSADSFDLQDEPENPRSIGHSYTFPRISKNPQFIRAWLRFLAEMVAQRLRQQNLVSQTVHLWLSGPEIGGFGAQKAFQQATNDGDEIFRRCRKIMAKLGPQIPKVRALGVTCSKLLPAAYPPLFKEQEKREALLRSIDQINSRLGEGSIYPAIVASTRKM